MTILSIDEESRNHWRIVMGDQDFAILFNGVVQRDVRYVNTERGFIERFKRLPNGHLDCDMKKGRVRSEKVYGKVEIIPNPDNTIKRLLGDSIIWLDTTPLSYESEYLLTAPFEELMQRQRNRERHYIADYTITERRIVAHHPELLSDKYRERIKELFEASDEEARRQWLYGDWS